MTVATAQTADAVRGGMPATRTGGGFFRYLSMLCEVLDEALQQTLEVRRKYPFTDV